MIRFLAIILCSASLLAADTKRDGIAATKIDGVTSAAKVDGVTISGGGGGGSTLNTDLIAYWNLDEATGTRADSETTGTAQDLTPVNSPTSAAGVIGDAVSINDALSSRLSRVDSADLSSGDIDFSICAWVYISNKTADRNAVTKYGQSGQREWRLFYNSSADRIEFEVHSSGTTPTSVTASSFGSPSASTWYFVAAVHDSSADQISISVNDGAVDSASFSGGPVDGIGDFLIGARASSSGSSSGSWSGRIDEVGFWKKALTTSEITELFNSGTGKTYPF